MLVKFFVCGLVDMPLGFAVLEYLDKLSFQPVGGALEMGL